MYTLYSQKSDIHFIQKVHKLLLNFLSQDDTTALTQEDHTIPASKYEYWNSVDFRFIQVRSRSFLTSEKINTVDVRERRNIKSEKRRKNWYRS